MEKKELPCIRHALSFDKSHVIVGTMANVYEKKKVIRKQRRSEEDEREKDQHFIARNGV